MRTYLILEELFVLSEKKLVKLLRETKLKN